MISNDKTIISNAHGGLLITSQDIKLDEGKINKLEKHKITISQRVLSDLELIVNGGLSPMMGFMNRTSYKSTLESMHLVDGILFPFPITLPVDNNEQSIKASDTLGLSFNGKIIGYIEVEDIYKRDKIKEAKSVYLTDDEKHPGVAMLLDESDTLVGGKVYADLSLFPNDFKKYRLTPYESRQAFNNKGWKSVVGFQTRNPIHRAHEYLIKCALEMVDGAFIHPLMGGTKSDDIPADVRLLCYETLISGYFPKDRVILGVFPATMRYAGPKEAIFHAIVRKNYGCTHFIVGRDHAGVGKYYGTFDAQKIFDELPKGSIDITILKFDNSFYCTKCESMASTKTCPHSVDAHISLSGTRLREMLSEGLVPDKAITRQEVAKVLIESMRNK
jgi:sulfate adenylyltransferase